MNDNEVMQDQELKCDESACATCGACEPQEESQGYTHQELLEKFSEVCMKVQLKADMPEAEVNFSQNDIKILAIVHSLFIPKEVVNIQEEEDSIPIGECPRCGSKVIPQFNNCVNCGQTLANGTWLDMIKKSQEEGISLDTPINIELEEQPEVERSVIPEVVEND